MNVPAIEKLVDYAASGIGSVAGSMLAPWQARRETQAKLIAADGDAKIQVMQAEAQSKAREILASRDTEVTGELEFTNKVNQRIQFQEQKRQHNIGTVVRKAASHLVDKSVENSEPDHDWTARFFNDIQDVSSEEMQNLWAKVLAGEVERAGSTSIRTLESVRGLYVGLQSFRSMSRMDASLMKASALRLRFSQSLASRRQRLSQAMVRSTTQRLGWTTKPFTRSDRLTISVSRSGRMPARAR